MHNKQAWDKYDLSASAKQALAVIEGAGEPLEPRTIAERLIITTGSMTSLLDTLEKRGLIVRRPHPSDRRRLLVDVTPDAVAILDDLLPSFHQRERAVIDGALSEQEQRKLLDLLGKVQASMKDHAGDEPYQGARRRRRST